MDEIVIKDFMGIFPNAFSKEYCDKLIEHFDVVQETRGDGVGGILTRQKLEGALPMSKDSDVYFFETEPDITVLESNTGLLQEFNEIVFQCYNKFKEKYGILESLGLHKMSYSVKIQKYKPSQGYHVWHCDAAKISSSRRMMVALLYLNTVDSGGETEFLYQNTRVPAVQGTLTLTPAGWTHPHRGNPPLKGNKYIMNTWLEYME